MSVVASEEPAAAADGCPLGAADCPLPERVRVLSDEARRLAELVEVDPLTGLFNYRRLARALEQELERTRRSGLVTSLIMVDLDHFKRVNDTFGHEGGNRALRNTAAVLREQTRRIDLVCRYGGEEFAIVLPGTPLSGAVRAAERLRAALEASPVQLDGQLVTVTASFGVDCFRAEDEEQAEQFVDRVDRHLLQAKAEGRNRVGHPPLQAVTAPTGITLEEQLALFGGLPPRD